MSAATTPAASAARPLVPAAPALTLVREAAPAVLLIGTPDTVQLARRQLALIGAPDPVGSILVGSGGAPAPSAEGATLGSLQDLEALHKRHAFSLAVVSIPAAMADAATAVRAALRRLQIPERTLQPLSDLLAPDSPANGSSPRPTWSTPTLDMADIIGREPHAIDRASVARILTGKRVLITGAGGSIGSEIARIVAGFDPELLILMERSENALFEIDRQLARRFPQVKRKALLHDVVDADATLRHLVDLKPHTLFHAAAHKHVPLMEDHPAHAVTNNLFGTKSIADAALAVGAERFVMISSDKAVNPTSVMGATKRLAELYVQSLHAQARDSFPSGRTAYRRGHTPTRFSMVRFGNVLGSACSVLPIWASQIAEGGPITVTDPRMTRYFMTIPEAATLVIQSAACDADANADTSGVYVLDMGEPIKILDLAQRFVRAHGLEPRIIQGATARPEGRAVPEGHGLSSAPTLDITLTGARPGEKIHEELAYAAEQLRPTTHPGINGWIGATHHDFDATGMIADLSAVRSTRDKAAVLTAIRRHVPEMSPAAFP
jgi:FlaA1/EpsC-like NDP-sugar epimerase